MTYVLLKFQNVRPWNLLLKKRFNETEYSSDREQNKTILSVHTSTTIFFPISDLLTIYKTLTNLKHNNPP